MAEPNLFWGLTSGTFQLDYAGTLASLGIVVNFIIIIAVSGFIIWYLLRLRTYNIKVEIKSQRISSISSDAKPTYKIIRTRGAYIWDKRLKSTIFKMLKFKGMTFEPPPLDYLESVTRSWQDFFISNQITGVQTSDNRVYWTKPAYLSFKKCPVCKGKGKIQSINSETGEQTGKIVVCPYCEGRKEIPFKFKHKVAEKDLEFWGATEAKADMQKYSDEEWWKPFIFPVSIITASVILLLAIYFIMDKIGAVSSICSANLQACTKMAQACAGTIKQTAAEQASQAPAW